MIVGLFNGHGSDFVGTATVGSSEAIILGLLEDWHSLLDVCRDCIPAE